MIVLGIESTAHTIGIGLYDGKKLIHELDVYRPKNEGIIPRKVADHHQKHFPYLLKSILQQSNISLKNVDYIAYSQGPGIGQPLQFGASMARYLASKAQAKIIPVNHCAAHVEIGIYDTKVKDPLFVYVSGGNTQLIIKDKQYRVLGETLDIGMGNLFDVLGRNLGLEDAHGSVLEKIASKGKYLEDTPYSVKGMNITFGGLLTHAKKKYEEGYKKEDIAYSVMHNAFAMMIEATERALCLSNKNEILIAGGVVQNKMFRGMIQKMLKQHNGKLGIPKNEYNADNGAMITYTGYKLIERYEDKCTLKIDQAIPNTKWRIDQVKYV